MIDLAHEEVNLLLARFAFGNVRNGADEAGGPPLRPGALEISKPMSVDPADLAITPQNPVLMRVRGEREREREGERERESEE